MCDRARRQGDIDAFIIKGNYDMLRAVFNNSLGVVNIGGSTRWKGADYHNPTNHYIRNSHVNAAEIGGMSVICISPYQVIVKKEDAQAIFEQMEKLEDHKVRIFYLCNFHVPKGFTLFWLLFIDVNFTYLHP